MMFCQEKYKIILFYYVRSFTKQGDGAGQLLPVPSAAVQLDQLLHQVTVATSAVPNLTGHTHTPESAGQRLIRI